MVDRKNDYSTGLEKVINEIFPKFGGQVVITQSFQEGDTDFNGQLTSIKGAEPGRDLHPRLLRRRGAHRQAGARQGAQRAAHRRRRLGLGAALHHRRRGRRRQLLHQPLLALRHRPEGAEVRPGLPEALRADSRRAGRHGLRRRAHHVRRHQARQLARRQGHPRRARRDEGLPRRDRHGQLQRQPRRRQADHDDSRRRGRQVRHSGARRRRGRGDALGSRRGRREHEREREHDREPRREHERGGQHELRRQRTRTPRTPTRRTPTPITDGADGSDSSSTISTPAAQRQHEYVHPAAHQRHLARGDLRPDRARLHDGLRRAEAHQLRARRRVHGRGLHGLLPLQRPRRAVGAEARPVAGRPRRARPARRRDDGAFAHHGARRDAARDGHLRRSSASSSSGWPTGPCASTRA